MQAITSAPPKLQPLFRYILAVAFVSLALSMSLVLRVSFGNPFWLFFPVAVIASTWFGGKGPGWVAVGLSSLVVLYYFIPPLDSFTVKPRDVPFFLTFVACQLVANWVIAWRRETENSLRQARDELEGKVAERTAELKTANELLLNQIAEQKRTEEALQITRTELARVVRITTIGELTASIAHEVNQPLAAVVANADACVAWLALGSPNLTEARAAAERATQGATRASEVIVRIRSLINKATPEKSPIHINEVIEEIAALAEGQASKNNVTLVLQLGADLPAALGDRIQLQQVILNLIVNGIEAMNSISGPRELCIKSRMQNDEILVSVHDSGIGVSPDLMPRLFEPFFTTRSQGIGMGLPISRSIVESHGGRLWAESTLNQGSIFHFTLPAGDGSSA
jgi:C4-dicarboxylate-specific signal transduction histidine kinase